MKNSENKNLVPSLNLLIPKVKDNNNFKEWKSFLKEKLKVGNVLAIDEVGQVLQKYGVSDFEDIPCGELFGIYNANILLKEWIECGILFVLTAPALPIQRIHNTQTPDELAELQMYYEPPIICCTLKKEDDAELYLSPFDEYYENLLPEKVKEVFYKNSRDYNGVEGTWEEIAKLFFELQNEIKKLTEAPEFPDSLKKNS